MVTFEHSLLSFLHTRFLHTKGHPPHLFLHKNRRYLHDFSTFSSFPPSFPLADKKVSDFAVLYSIENQDV